MTDTPLTATPAEVKLPTAPGVPPSNGGEDLRGQLAKAVDEIAALKAERDRESVEREAAVAAERLKVASAIAKQPSPKIGTAEQDIKFDKAMSSVGGRAFFATKFTPEQQAELVGVHVGDTSIATVEHYFGPKSSSKEANALGMTNPKEYARLRAIAKLRGLIRTWIVPIWGAHSLSDVRTVNVEEWLGSIPLANASKAKIRSIMHALFNHAMRYEFFDRNPISLVRQSAKREKVPDVLTAEEIGALLAELRDPYRVAVLLAACTGLRVSELLALKWEDIHFEAEEIRPARAIVDAHIGSLKTEASGRAVPMAAELASSLFDWRRSCPYNQDTDFVFGSPEMNGTQPYWPDSMLRKIIRPAAVRAGITKHIGWHSFRRSLATLLQASGASVKATQDMLRHASSRLTLELYAQTVPEDRREAQAGILRAVTGSVPKRSLINL